MKIRALTCLMLPLFFFGKASACSVDRNSIDFSESTLTSGFTGGQHKVELGPIGGSLTSVVSHTTIFRSCNNTNGVARYYAEYNGVFGEPVSHFGNPDTVVYQLPGAHGFGVSFDVADPKRNWVQLVAAPGQLLIDDNHPTIGFRARVQVHIIGDIKSDTYFIPRTKVGTMRVETDKTNSPPTVDLYSPPIELNVNVHTCKLQVPSKVKLDDDISKPTPFEVVVTQCGGKVNVFSRFSDAKNPTATGQTLQNSGSALGFALQLETEDGKPVQIIPTGTNHIVGEIGMGEADINIPITRKFQARVVEEGGEQQPGTLDFKTIVGVAYR